MPDSSVSEDPIAPKGSIQLAPLPVPVANPALKPIRRARRARKAVSLIPAAAMVPLFYAALLYLAGIILARYAYLRPALLLAGLAPLAAMALVAIAKAPRLTWLSLSAIWLVLGTWSAETEVQPAPNPTIAQLADGLLRTVEGTVTDAGPLRARELPEEDADDPEPPTALHPEQLQRVDLQVTSAEVVTDATDAMTPISTADEAKIRVTISFPAGSSVREIRCGQRLRAVVRILPPDTFHDPGVWSRAVYLESQEVSAIASVNALRRDAGEPRLALLGEGSSTACLLSRWRNAATANLESLPSVTRSLPRALRATPEDAAMLAALLTGDRTFLTHTLRLGFERTGTFHLIVVSGLHLAILAGCVFALARRLRLPRLAATLLTIAVSLGYALFTGFAIPAQRSFWMITLYLVGRLFYRNRSPLNVIGFATLCLAADSPRSIFDASMQMTLLAVAAIGGIGLPLCEHTLSARIKATKNLRTISIDPKLPPQIAQFRVTLRLLARHIDQASHPALAWTIFPLWIRSVFRLGELLFVPLVVELALALPMALYFHRITLYALPVNLIILPLLAILVPAAMILLLALAVWPTVAAVPAAVTLGVLHLSVWIVRRFGTFSFGDLRAPDPAQIQIAAALLLFVAALQLARSRYRPLALVALGLMMMTALWPRAIDHPGNALLFEAIDVGQGDSLLLVTPEGKTLLVDAGGVGLGFTNARSRTGPSEFDIGEEVVSPTLWSRGIRRLDAVALTHAHHDHMGGLAAILRNFRPRELWVGNNPPVAAYTALIEEAQSLGVQVRSLHAGEDLALGSLHLRVLAPEASYRPGPQPGNNDSLVLKANYQASYDASNKLGSILLEGDAEAPEENSILARTGMHSTMLKVGHHGSRTSTQPAFLAEVAPAWAVISCGRRNRFGHPRPEILAELQAAHARTFRTDLDGATCFLLDGQTVTPQPLCRELP